MTESHREIVLDTETTGFGVEDHRIIEIGCVEMVNKLPTGRTFHHYCNPERPIDFGSTKVHGITDEKVADAPKFRDIALSFLEFMGTSPLIAHNAEFDVSFINAELARAGHPAMTCEVIDTLAIAKQKLPGQRHNLDALCRHFNVDNSGRTFHGALLDAQLLADVYVELTGGLQATLELAAETVTTTTVTTTAKGNGKIVTATTSETTTHTDFLQTHIPNALWTTDTN
ncbi:MAG: DNA polymerase III subunit epsilon [Pseudomonadaceae bacterium]|nr:DNA polymerase III subunit epsilon [Pseudomonadaceae bacterium]